MVVPGLTFDFDFDPHALAEPLAEPGFSLAVLRTEEYASECVQAMGISHKVQYWSPRAPSLALHHFAPRPVQNRPARAAFRCTAEQAKAGSALMNGSSAEIGELDQGISLQSPVPYPSDAPSHV